MSSVDVRGENALEVMQKPANGLSMREPREIASELDSICDQICRLFEKEELKTKVRKLQKAAVNIASWVGEYNFGDCQANGYISLLMIGLKLGSMCVQSAGKMENPRVEKDISNLLEIALIAVDVLEKLREDSVSLGKSADLRKLKLD